LETDVIVSTKSRVIRKKLCFVGILKAADKMSRIRIRIQIGNPMCGSKDPDPSQNVTELDVGTLIYYLLFLCFEFAENSIWHCGNIHGQDLGGFELR
jgi:hypothetical protein